MDNFNILSWNDKIAYNYCEEKLTKLLQGFPKKDYKNIHEKINIKFKPNDTTNPALIKKIQDLENAQNRLKVFQKEIDIFNRKKERRVLRPFNVLTFATQSQEENFQKIYNRQNTPIKIVFNLNENGEVNTNQLFLEIDS